MTQSNPSLHDPKAPAWQGQLTLGLLAVSVALSVMWLVHGLGYVEDDGWIHLVYARSFALGKGFMFDGRIVYGDTAPLWVWLLDATHLLIPTSWPVTAKVLCSFGCVFGYSGVWAFARSATRPLPVPSSRLFAAVAILVLSTGAYFGYWAFSGMEALTACGLAGWACALASRPRLRPVTFLAVALMAGLAPLLRPEMGFLSVLLGLALLYRLFRGNDFSPAERTWLFLVGVVLLMLPFGLWARYAVHHFGSVLPTTNAAKRASADTSIVKQLISIYGFGFPIAAAGSALIVGWALVKLARSGTATVRERAEGLGLSVWLIAVWVCINTTFYIVNHTYVQSRYIFVTSPLLTTAVLAAAVLYWPKTYRLAVAVAVISGTFLCCWTSWIHIQNEVLYDVGMKTLSDRLLQLPPDTPIGIYSIGEFSYYCDCHVVDLGGIMYPGVIPYMFDGGKGRINAWLRAQGGQYVIGPKPSPDALMVDSVPTKALGWFMNRKIYQQRIDFQLWTLPPGRTDPENMPKE